MRASLEPEYVPGNPMFVRFAGPTTPDPGFNRRRCRQIRAGTDNRMLYLKEMTVLSTIIAPPAAPQRRSDLESNPRAGEILAALRERGGRPIGTWQLLDQL